MNDITQVINVAYKFPRVSFAVKFYIAEAILQIALNPFIFPPQSIHPSSHFPNECLHFNPMQLSKDIQLFYWK